MKLFGGSSDSRHKSDARRSGGSHIDQAASKVNQRKRRIILTLVIALVAVASLLTALTLAARSAIRPPDTTDVMRPGANAGSNSGGESTGPGGGNEGPNQGGGDTDTPGDPTGGGGDQGQGNTGGETGGETPVTRTEEKYTFAIFGLDVNRGNTDVVMIATFDADDYTLDIVSIPRDTLVNVPWNNKRVNACYGIAPRYGYKGIDYAMDSLGDILGYDLDHHVLVDLKAFEVLITALSEEMGGIWFDVPQDMDYDDPAQDLYIHIKKGYQLIDAETAIGLVRFRSYPTADIGRIGMQQQLLMAIAKQVLENYDKISITAMANIFLNYVKTDMDLGNVTWLVQRFLRMDFENITFHKMPGDYAHLINGQSYIPIDVDDWLTMVNTYLNPFDTDVTYEMLDILTVDERTGKVYSTSGNYEGDPNWGN